jgi:hypothetical protein
VKSRKRVCMHIRFRSLLVVAFSLSSAPGQSIQKDVPEPDVLVFKTGERLIGRFVRSDGQTIIFRSDSLGEVKVSWAKVQDLQSPQVFAVIGKQTRLRKGDDIRRFARGTLTVRDNSLVVSSPEQDDQRIGLKDTSHVLDRQEFERAMSRHHGFFQAWKGTLTGGVSVVQATQTSQTYTTAIGLVRSIPMESWLERRQRTLLNINAAYGTLTQPNAPELRTEILHGDLEHDVYFTNRFFGFGQTAFDHNFSQGLSLAQNYGGGIGWTVLKRDKSEMDLRTSLAYLRQEFADPTQDQNLIGSIFAQSFSRRFRRDTKLTQHLIARPAWNNLNAYSATGDLTLTVPVYRRLTFTVGIVNTFINNPSPGFRKNSFQATTGLTYSLP